MVFDRFSEIQLFYFLPYINFELDAENTDHWAMDHGYVAVTPTSIDVTAYHFMEELKDWHL